MVHADRPHTGPGAARPAVLACGAWLKNTACLLGEGEPLWSAAHGDLGDPAACAALEESVHGLLAAHGQRVDAVAHDLHPDFFSTRLALALAAQWGVPAVAVQHHQAHMAAVLAEHAHPGPAVGLMLDGTGLGTDGSAWGGELLWMHGADWRRLGHLLPLALPGGDRAASEPWRMAASALHAMGLQQDIAPRFAAVVGHALAAGVQHMLAGAVNCPTTSSAGRWFDAAAGALGLSVRQTGEAQAAQALEAAAQRALALNPGLPSLPGAVIDAHNRLDLRALMSPLFAAHASETDAMAAGFHLALADALALWAQRAALEQGCAHVCLGGGCFANRLLRERVTDRLQAVGLVVLSPVRHSCGDASLALGQAWVAQHLLASQVYRASLKEPEACV